MPELPEVEDAAGRLREAILGQTIARVSTRHPSQARRLPAADCDALAGVRIERIERRAKVQLLHGSDGSVLEVHFRMTGDWAFSRPADPAPRFERVRIETRDGVVVSLVDSRALSVVTRHAPGAFSGIRAGPEPLTSDFTAAGLLAALRTRRRAIKPVLLDQQVVAGVGNIYASEALWEARMHPEAPAHRLSRARVTRLVDAIRTVLTQSPRGRYFATGDSEPTPHDESWRVYGRAGAPCHRCGATIRQMVQAQRSSYWCPRCQRG